jgi:hypothetical protein
MYLKPWKKKKTKNKYFGFFIIISRSTKRCELGGLVKPQKSKRGSIMIIEPREQVGTFFSGCAVLWKGINKHLNGDNGAY